MKLTTARLKKLIREELAKIPVNEPDRYYAKGDNMDDNFGSPIDKSAQTMKDMGYNMMVDVENAIEMHFKSKRDLRDPMKLQNAARDIALASSKHGTQPDMERLKRVSPQLAHMVSQQLGEF